MIHHHNFSTVLNKFLQSLNFKKCGYANGLCEADIFKQLAICIYHYDYKEGFERKDMKEYI